LCWRGGSEAERVAVGAKPIKAQCKGGE